MVNLRGQNWNTLQTELERIAKLFNDTHIKREWVWKKSPVAMCEQQEPLWLDLEAVPGLY